MQPLTNDDPRHVGPFRIVGVLGTGGMGRVYLGRDTDGQTAAVKTARRELADDGHFRKRFAREVAAAQRVGGRFVAPVIAAAPHVDVPWMATEYVPGLSLGTVVDRYGPLSEEAAGQLASGLLQALSAVHAQGLVHRDLKPSNIILTAAGPRVIDFGVARSTVETTLTTTGAVLGTPGYMAPEQLTTVGPELTGSADVFAFGGVLVFATTGDGPFGTAHPHVLMYRAMHEEPGLENVPRALARTAAACLEKAPDRRPTMATLTSHFGTPHYSDWLPEPLASELHRLSSQLDAPEDAPPPRVDVDRSAPDPFDDREALTGANGPQSPPESAPVTGRERSALPRSAPQAFGRAPEPHGPGPSLSSPTRPVTPGPSRRRVLTALSCAGIAAGGGALAWGLWPEGKQTAGDARKPAGGTGEPPFELPRGSRKIDAVMPMPDDTDHYTPSRYWLFAGDRYFRVRISSSTRPVRTNLKAPAGMDTWDDTLGREGFRGGIDAVMRVPGERARYWVFSESEYIRIKVADSPPYGDELEAGPRPISDWADVFGEFRGPGIDAVMPVPDHPNRVWVFSGNQYVQAMLNNGMEPGGTVATGTNGFDWWTGTLDLVPGFKKGIDAAMPLPGERNHYWVFSGSQYMKIRVSDGDYTDTVLQEPRMLRAQPRPEPS